MMHWWETEQGHHDGPPKVRAVAYYRHSAQDRQENSIPIQREQVQEWAMLPSSPTEAAKVIAYRAAVFTTSAGTISLRRSISPSQESEFGQPQSACSPRRARGRPTSG